MARTSRKTTTQAIVQQSSWRAGLYLRLSVEDIRKKANDSIGTQRLVVEQHLAKCSDIRVEKIYEDINFSGTNFERPAFKEMMSDLQRGVVNCILVKDLSRFGRNYIESGNYLEKVFPFLGVRFISVNDHYDSLTAQSIDTGLLLPLKNIMHEVYARDISKKVRSQYALKRKNGEFCGAFAPYGYIKCGNKLEIDADAAAIVQQIFQWVSDGKSDEAVVQLLNRQGIPSPTQHRYQSGILKAGMFEDCKYWYRSVIKRICENQAYVGRLAQGRYKTALFEANHRPINLPPEEWVVAEDTHTAIISEELFARVGELRRERKASYSQKLQHSHRPPSSTNIYRGLVVCGGCQSVAFRHKAVRANGQVVYYYLCNLYEQVNKKHCEKLYFSEESLHACVKAALDAQIMLFCELDGIIAERAEQPDQRKKVSLIQSQMEALCVRVDQVGAMKAELLTDRRDGILSQDDFDFFMEEYNKELDVARQRHKELEQLQLEERYGDSQWIQQTSRFVDREFCPEMVVALVERILLFPSGAVRIVMCFQDDMKKVIERLRKEERQCPIR